MLKFCTNFCWLVTISLFIAGFELFQLGFVPLLYSVLLISFFAYVVTFKSNDYLVSSVCVFFYVFLWLAPAQQVVNFSFPWFDYYREKEVFAAWLIVFLFFLCFVCGWFFSESKLSSGFQKKIFGSICYSNRERVVFYFGLFFFMLLAFFLLVQNGGISSVFMARNELASQFAEDVSSSMITQALIRVPVFIISLLFIFHLFFSGVSLKFFDWVVVIVAIAFVLVVNNPISTPRFWFGSIVISYLLLLNFRYFKIGSALFSYMNIFLLVAVFPLMSAFRVSLDIDIFELVFGFDYRMHMVTSGDFDAFQQIVNAVVVVDLSGVRFGSQILSAILFFIPRALWPSKSYGTGQYIAEELGYSYTNLSSPLPIEFYVDFHLLGVIVGGSLVGFFYSRISKFGDLYVPLIIFFVSYQTFLFRGSLLSTINFMVFAISVYFICVFILRFRLKK